jgi:hypothetical protein
MVERLKFNLKSFLFPWILLSISIQYPSSSINRSSKVSPKSNNKTWQKLPLFFERFKEYFYPKISEFSLFTFFLGGALYLQKQPRSYEKVFSKTNGIPKGGAIYDEGQEGLIKLGQLNYIKSNNNQSNEEIKDVLEAIKKINRGSYEKKNIQWSSKVIGGQWDSNEETIIEYHNFLMDHNQSSSMVKIQWDLYQEYKQRQWQSNDSFQKKVIYCQLMGLQNSYKAPCLHLFMGLESFEKDDQKVVEDHVFQWINGLPQDNISIDGSKALDYLRGQYGHWKDFPWSMGNNGVEIYLKNLFKMKKYLFFQGTAVNQIPWFYKKIQSEKVPINCDVYRDWIMEILWIFQAKEDQDKMLNTKILEKLWSLHGIQYNTNKLETHIIQWLEDPLRNFYNIGTRKKTHRPLTKNYLWRISKIYIKNQEGQQKKLDEEMMAMTGLKWKDEYFTNDKFIAIMHLLKQCPSLILKDNIKVVLNYYHTKPVDDDFFNKWVNFVCNYSPEIQKEYNFSEEKIQLTQPWIKKFTNMYDDFEKKQGSLDDLFKKLLFEFI